MAQRLIVLDTETTGLNAKLGDRVIEIGCVELFSRRVTDRNFHTYLNPERDIEEGAAKVHGLTREFLADKPRFVEVASDFLDYLRGAELVIHNASFDVEFLDQELELAGRGRLADHAAAAEEMIAHLIGWTTALVNQVLDLVVPDFMAFSGVPFHISAPALT